ncbi:hypothetical protein EV714DRAFT_274716 [Schizophyllum commune]
MAATLSARCGGQSEDQRHTTATTGAAAAFGSLNDEARPSDSSAASIKLKLTRLRHQGRRLSSSRSAHRTPEDAEDRAQTRRVAHRDLPESTATSPRSRQRSRALATPPLPLRRSQARLLNPQLHARPPNSAQHPKMSTSIDEPSRQFPAISRARSPSVRGPPPLILPDSALLLPPPPRHDGAGIGLRALAILLRGSLGTRAYRVVHPVAFSNLTMSNSTPPRRFQQPQDGRKPAPSPSPPSDETPASPTPPPPR